MPDNQMWLFYAGSAALLVSGVFLVWKVQGEYTSKQKLAQTTAVGVWIWYLLHAALTVYAAWRSVWPLTFDSLPAAVVGSLLAIAGLAMAIAGVLELRSLQRMSGRETDRLVTSGIYAWSRNPQNVGWFLVLVGAAVTGRSGGALLLAALFALTLHVYIVYVEEPYLAQVYGAAYGRYRAATSRYLGPPDAGRGSD